MAFIADGLLIFGALSAALYCLVLSRKIKSLMRLDSGLGGAISALSSQVDEIQTSVKAATKASGASLQELMGITSRAEIAAGRLELLMVSVHERGKEPKSVNIQEERRERKKESTDNNVFKDAQGPSLDEMETEENDSTRANLLNALQKVMAAAK